MKTALRVIILLAAIMSGHLAGRFFIAERGPAASNVAAPGETTSSLQTDRESPPAGNGRTLLGDSVVVGRVVDGDTIEIEGGLRVRYIGIETPELVHPERPVECFAEEAAAKNRELVYGKLVQLERDVSDRDRYGRFLRYVWENGEMVNLKLIAEGYASAVNFPPDVKYAKEFLAAERRAREEGKGLWRACAAAGSQRLFKSP